MPNSILLKSSLAKKYWMAFTGLFLCLFLIGHLLGNLQLLITDIHVAKDQFNEYALFMTTNPVVKILSYLTYISIIFHAIDGIILTVANRKARKVNYVVNKKHTNSAWNSRNMGILGTVILVFIIVHMYMFWGEMHFGKIETYTTQNEKIVKDLYSLTVKVFQDESSGIVWSLIYAISMLALGLHLHHGLSSGFQSLGINSPRYKRLIKMISTLFVLIISFLFAIIPFYIHFALEKI